MNTIVICQNCGKNTPDGRFCEHCGRPVQIARVSGKPALQQHISHQQPGAGNANKNAGIAALQSLFLGLGQIYNGQTGRGIVLFFVVVILMY